MPSYPFVNAPTALLILRVAVALMLCAHGIMRAYVNSMEDFGGFLESKGFPAGVAIAWGITLFEMIGGVLLAFGFFARWIALVFMIEIAMGIILVHARNGWFVVGHQSGGVEYSVLLIFVLFTVAATSPLKK